MVTEPDDEEDPEDRWADPEAEVHERFGDYEQEVADRYPDYEESAPNAPPAPDVTEAEPDRDTQVAFWAAVVYANAGLFLVALGPMLAFFRGQHLLGGGMFVAGLLAFARVYTIYRAYVQRRKERRSRGSEDTERGNGSTDAEAETGSADAESSAREFDA